RTVPAECHPSRSQVGQGELSAWIAAGTHRAEGGGGPATRARQDAARAGRSCPAVAPPAAGSRTMRLLFFVFLVASTAPARAQQQAPAKPAVEQKRPSTP